MPQSRAIILRLKDAAKVIFLFTKPTKDVTFATLVTGVFSWAVGCFTILGMLGILPSKESIDAIILLVTLIGTARIAEGVILGRKEVEKLLKPRIASGRPSLNKEDHEILRNVISLLVEASKYCYEGLQIITVALLVQLGAVFFK